MNTHADPAATYGIFIDASGTLLRAVSTQSLGVDVFPDARKLLKAFAQRRIGEVPIRTAIITNWGIRIHQIIRALGIEEHFDAVVCADDVVRAKPDTEIFHTACQWTKVRPSQAIHIGDSLFDDALGAQQAGLQSLWLNRHTRSLSPQIEEMYVSKLVHPWVQDLEQALVFLEIHLKERAKEGGLLP